MKFKAILAAIHCAALLIPSSAIAGAGDTIGSTVRVVNQVTAGTDQTTHPLAQGDDVRQNETIEVAAQSLGELRLNDETKLALGPGAKLKLDTFVYDPGKADGAIAVDLAKGAMRFITGLARKNTYSIRSPNASITVRGTIFDVYVEASGVMWVLLHEGSIEICNSAQQCKVINDPCGIIRVGVGGELTDPAKWNRLPDVEKIDFATAFPFVENPPQIDAAPRFTRASVETGSCVSDEPRLPETRRAELPQRPTPRASVSSHASSAQPALPATPPNDVPADDSGVGDGGIAVTMPEATEPAGPRRWSGAYAGVNFGGGWDRGDTRVGCDDPSGSFDTVSNTPNCAFPIRSGALETRYATDPRGFIGGGQVGYNIQMGNTVWGVEADFSLSSIDGKDTQSRNVPPTSPGTRTVEQDMDWFGTLRGRFGFVSGDWLLYATSGLAVGRVEYSYQSDFPQGNAFARVSQRSTEIGWTAGLGAELALGLWSLKGEYLYYDLGQEELRTRFFINGGTPTAAFFEPEFETQGHIIRVGLNYHFN